MARKRTCRRRSKIQASHKWEKIEGNLPETEVADLPKCHAQCKLLVEGSCYTANKEVSPGISFCEDPSFREIESK